MSIRWHTVVFGFKKSKGSKWTSRLHPRGQRWHSAIHEVQLTDWKPNILYWDHCLGYVTCATLDSSTRPNAYKQWGTAQIFLFCFLPLPFLFFSLSVPFQSQKCMKLSNTKRVRTYCKWGVSHYDGTPCSQDHLIGEDYAKMNAGPCKMFKTHCRMQEKQWKMERHKPKVKVKTHICHIYIYITPNIVIFWPSGPFLCHRRCAGVSLLARFLAHPALVGPWAAGWDQAPRCHGALVETAQDLARPPGRRSSCVDRCSLASWSPASHG